jgi:hypothetical protein
MTEKIDNMIKWLEKIPFIKSNPTAMQVLPTFRDTQWAKGYIQMIIPAYDKDPEVVLDDLIKQCDVEKDKFNKEQLDKMRLYLACFVDSVKDANK